jgi:transitional endoplasmic reticulum ATPase
MSNQKAAAVAAMPAAAKAAIEKAIEKAVEDHMKNLADAKAAPVVAEVVRAGTAVMIPEGMSIAQVRRVLDARERYEQESVEVNATINCFPWDGAVAMHRVLTRIYGWAEAVLKEADSFFDKDQPPQMINVLIGPTETVQVPWGRFKLPNINGFIDTETNKNAHGLVVFALKATVKRESEATVKALFDEIRAEALANSIYRGKAIKIRFRDDDTGRVLPLPMPEFMDTDAIDDSLLVYSEEIMQAVQTNLFTPIERVHDCIANGIPIKRGVLLAGTYGTGKTLAATVAAKKAVAAGQTYIYVPRADELPLALAFARHYQSPACVVFCEDIDRVASGDRSVSMDDLLNIIDGIDSKTANIIVVLTTNELEEINAAMLRPGRLDAVIEIMEPDAKAIEKLLRLYGKGAISPETDLTRAGVALAGCIPAIVAEVVKRAKLAQIKYLASGEKIVTLTEEAVVEAANTMSAQIKLLKRLSEGEPKPELPSLDLAMINLLDKRNEVAGGNAYAHHFAEVKRQAS